MAAPPAAVYAIRMNAVDRAVATQMQNIQVRTGKSLEELFAWIGATPVARHGEIVDLLKRDLGLGHGDAATLAHAFLAAASPKDATADPLDAIYAGRKAHLRPIHDALMAAIGAFGDFEVAPKKANVSLRRKKQFALIGPATSTRVEVGINAKGLVPNTRLLALPPGGMCPLKVDVHAVGDVDGELLGWIRVAYDAAR